MNTLREAVEEYLSMRRHLGFKLHDTERGLLDFVTFLEQRQAAFITQSLALAWAQQPLHVQPAPADLHLCSAIQLNQTIANVPITTRTITMPYAMVSGFIGGLH